MKRACIAHILLLIAVASATAQHKSPEATESVYTSPDGIFQFRYSASWNLFPKPSSESETCQGKLVCVESPPEYYKGYDFADATFWVRFPLWRVGLAPAQPVLTKSDCLNFRTHTEPVSTITINGVKFTTLSLVGAALGTTHFSRLFRTFHDGKCYELVTDLSRISSGYEKNDYVRGRIKHFSKADEKRVRAVLNSMVASFRFLQ